MTWEAISVGVADRVLGPQRIELLLPPGWWSLPVGAPGARDSIDAYLASHTVPEVRAGLGGELERLASVAATAGAVLMGIGAAVDEEARQVVTATLLLTPLRVADLPADSGPRTVTVVTRPTLFGDVRMLVANYVVARRWWLSLQTPSLGHADDLVPIFDTIAGTVRVAEGVGVADAFGTTPT